jgi:hypothetical protein
MPILMALVLALALVSSSPPSDPSGETVRLLVRADTPLGSAGHDSAGSTAGWQRVEVPVRGSVDQTAAELSAATGDRVVVEQRYELFAPQDEPGFGEQWYLENPGGSGAVLGADIDVITAWGSVLGAGVVVAVIDSGVNMTHPDLIGQIDPAKRDFVDDDNDPSPSGTDDSEGHGTAVAGIISAAVNGIGIVGVAPESTLMVVRSCSEGTCWSLDLAEGIRFAADQGADVINLSLGSVTTGDEPVAEAIAYAQSRDVLVVAAAGNESTDLDDLPPGQQLIPGGLPYSNIVTVAASDRSDSLTTFSNYGPGTVDIAAPGIDMLTTSVSGGYVAAQGTSFAAPVVAGVAALLLSSDPGIGHQELAARITAFVAKPAGVVGATSSGRVDAGQALTRRFVDTSSSVFVDSIDWLADGGITKGCNPPFNHRFCPGDRVTRGEMAVFLARAFQLPETNNDYFTDDDEAFYEGSANRLRAAGLTVGCGTNRYCGDRDIRRDEMAAMLTRALSLPITSSDFFDDDAGSIFENAINRIAASGVTKGCNPPANNHFCPERPVTRGEMAAFLKRSLEP